MHGRPLPADQSPFVEGELARRYEFGVSAHMGHVFLGCWSSIRRRWLGEGHKQRGENTLDQPWNVHA
jgi:hypothetical protein